MSVDGIVLHLEKLSVMDSLNVIGTLRKTRFAPVTFKQDARLDLRRKLYHALDEKKIPIVIDDKGACRGKEEIEGLTFEHFDVQGVDFGETYRQIKSLADRLFGEEPQKQTKRGKKK